MVNSSTTATLNAGRVDRPLLLSTFAGVILGCIELAALCMTYSATWEGWVLDAAKADAWKGPTLLIGSSVAVLVIYVVGVCAGAIRKANWFVLGYAMPLVVASGLVVAWQVFLVLRDRVPQNLGLRTVAVFLVAYG